MPPRGSATSSEDRPSTAEMYEVLQEAFPNHAKLFPCLFRWQCKHGKSVIFGFPGCSDVEHFLTRVYLAIWDYHQLQETSFQEIRLHSTPVESVLRYECFSHERKEALAADLLRANEALLNYGLRVRLPQNSPD